MFSKFFEKKTDDWIEKGKCSEENRDIVVYGLSLGIELILFIATTLLIGAVLGLLFQSVVFLGSYYMIRTFAGGYHCKTSTNCYLLSSGIVLIGLSIVKFTPEQFHDILAIFLLFFAIPVIVKKAPVEAVNKPLDETEKSRYRRIALTNLLIESIVLITLVLLDFERLALTIGISIFTASIMLLTKEKA